MEDTFVLPDAWLEHVHPRRGGVGVRPFTADPQARELVERMLAERLSAATAALGRQHTPEPIRAAAMRWLAGVPDPAGAAAVGLLTVPRRADERSLADVWITEHGLRFAALAAVEMASMLLVHVPGEGPAIRYRVPGDSYSAILDGTRTLLRIRAALAAAPETEFEQAGTAVERYRSGSVFARAACSVLIPRADWVEEDVVDTSAGHGGARIGMLLYAANTPAQAEALIRRVNLLNLGVRRDLAITLVAGAGPGVVPALFYWSDRAGNSEQLLSVLATLPGDDALGGLLGRSSARSARIALAAAAGRFPARALRLLAEAGDEMLRAHVIEHHELVDQVMPLLSPAAADRVRSVVSVWADVPVAPRFAVRVLADPPWRNRAKAAKPPVVTGLTCVDAASVSWLAGERQEWTSCASSHYADPATDWPALAAKVLDGTAQWWERGFLFTRAPEDVARPAFAAWQPETDYDTAYWLKSVATRFEGDVLPVVLGFARAAPAEFGPVLMPFTSPEVAVLMADWSARLKSVRRLARRWLLRHPGAAARALIPPALGPAGTARRQAERALLLLHGNGCTGEIRSAAAGYGPAATAGVEALFSADPLFVLPLRMPSPPVWASPGVMPPVRLRDGSGALPAESVANLVLMLMISRPDEPYAGLEAVRQAVEPADLARFGWSLFELWQSGGAVTRENWVLDAVAQTGDDDTVRRITPLITAWPTDGLTARAVSALSVLVGIGTDQALLHLHRISQKAKSGPLRKAAAGRLTEIADGLGLTAEQLADRLVPDFGLDSDGSLRLDYGPRQFVVGFDEQLRPFAADDSGVRLKALPQPGVKDDTEPAEAAYQRFATLKKDVRKIAAEQVRRLERAMVDGRRWTGAEFRRLFVEHPLMWHIGRRLVWARFAADGAASGAGGAASGADGPVIGAGGAVIGAVRIAEDRSLADVADNPVVLGDDDVVGVAHPVQLGADTARWAEVFADYELLQPFMQLKRPVFGLTEAEGAAVRLERFEGVVVPTKKVLTLDRRGWIRHEAANAGISHGFDRPAGPGRVLTVHLDPGIVGQVGYHEEQKLVALYLHDGGVSPWALTEGRSLPLSSLDPVIASEILRDLTDVTR
ncbi:MAG TPA: DUF4132 domain-containing protein [Actinoplanes sp.]|nr:DUF4132 domain-containing protein [Actinoplanes sp.]